MLLWDATISTWKFQGHYGRKGLLECHRGPHSPSWEVILLACLCLLLQIHSPYHICAPEAGLCGPLSRFPLSSGWLLVGFYQWEVLAAFGGRRTTGSECLSAEGHCSWQWSILHRSPLPAGNHSLLVLQAYR